MIGGGSTDPEKNTTLAAVLRTAKASGVPRDNIERALAKVRHQSLDKSCLFSPAGRPVEERIRVVSS